MQPLIFNHISKTLDNYDLFLFDLWGVVIENNVLYPGVVESINNILKYKRGIFLSNVPKPSFVVKNMLKQWGFKNVTSDMILTSGDIARELILKKASKLEQKKIRIYHLGGNKNNDLLNKLDHAITNDYKEADIVLLSLYRDQNESKNIRGDKNLFKNISKQRNILVICANPDISVPRGDTIRYCAGYFAKMIEKEGKHVTYTGKPNNLIYQKIFKRFKQIPKNRILMIGDTFETDILGAQNVGIDSALVLTGNSNKFHQMYKSLDEKIKILSQKAEELKIFPSFITDLA